MIYEEEDGGQDAGGEEEGEPIHQHISSLILMTLSLRCRTKPVIYEEEDGRQDAGEEEEGESVHQHVRGVVHPGHRRRKQIVQISLVCSAYSTFDFFRLRNNHYFLQIKKNSKITETFM